MTTRILIVDDDEIALELLRATLEESGHEVVSASNGVEALEKISDGSIRLVITDWEMPELDGIQLCRAIRRQASAGYTYIILLTSHSDKDSLIHGMAAGADDFLAKPFHECELNARVGSGLRILSLESHEMVIFALAKLADSRDPETGMHLERVRQYSRLLAIEVAKTDEYRDELDADYVRLIFQTSPLHDIGKVGIPDKVLLKPGRLTKEEFECMKRHTVIGAETLDGALNSFPNARFLHCARDIAAAHHERWDGSGYPNGLVGHEIPISARIVALADVYDALRSKRIYKDAYPHEVAADIIEKESGKHFDPLVVAAFKSLSDQFDEIASRMSSRVRKEEEAMVFSL